MAVETGRVTVTPQPHYPFVDGDVTVLGPGVFASLDRNVINWEGENYVPQQPAEAAPE
jgi:hypothetical protein